MSEEKSKNFKRSRKNTLQQLHQKEIKEFYKKILMLQEGEKKKISRDLHDETGQIVIALGAWLNLIEKELREGHTEKALELIGKKRNMIEDIADRMKSIARILRPPALGLLELPAVLRDYFSQCTKSTPIKIKFEENLKDTKLNEDAEITLYRIVQEVLYNIVRHARATEVKINLIVAGDSLQLYIEDNGKGFDINEYRKHQDFSKMGLRGVEERVGILSGDFYIESTQGKGTKLKVVLPLKAL